MEPSTHYLRNSSRTLLIREAVPEDARAILDYLAVIGGESDFLTFGRGELQITEPEEQAILRKFCEAENQLFILGLLDDVIVSTLSFSAGTRARIRHTGEFGMSVRREHWGKGIGSLMLDRLIAWGRENTIIAKINLHVRTDNLSAIRLYERKGFVVEGTISRGTCIDGTYFNQHCMGLEV